MPGRMICATVALVCATALASCAGDPAPQPNHPVAAAEAWVQAYWDAGMARVEAQAPFLAADVFDDQRAILGATYSTRWDSLENLRHWFGTSLDEMPTTTMYLDEGGVLWPTTVSLGQRSDYAMAVWARIGPDGIDTVRQFGGTTQAWDHAALYPYHRASAHELALRYERAWANHDAQELQSMYAPDATLRDAWHGVDLHGANAIREWAQKAGDPLVVDRAAAHHPALSDALGNAPAAYAYGLMADDGPLQQLWILAHSIDTCPGSFAIALSVDVDGRIVTERRLLAPESIGACLGSDEIPAGWWTDRDLPTPLADRVTGSITAGGVTIEVRNGSPRLDALVRATLDRFSEAGLAAPRVFSIAFDPYDPSCESFQGYAEWRADATAIVVCVDSDGTAWRNLTPDADTGNRFSAIDLLLHELGHAWLSAHLSADARAAFIDHVDLATWNDKAALPSARAVEWAAETLSWGLGGDLQTRFAFTSPSCTSLAEGFTLLTARDPLTSCADR